MQSPWIDSPKLIYYFTHICQNQYCVRNTDKKMRGRLAKGWILLSSVVKLLRGGKVQSACCRVEFDDNDSEEEDSVMK